jgi:hypothetical protein
MPSIRVILVRFAPRVFTTRGSGSAGKSFGSSQSNTTRDRGAPQPNFSKKPEISRASSIRTSSGSSYDNIFEDEAPTYMASAHIDSSMDDNQPLVPLSDLKPIETTNWDNVIKVSTRFSMRTVEQSPRHPIYDEFDRSGGASATGVTRRFP